ncbi:MAG: hypothetical protein ACREDL_01230 [Bradyrhizobium sp.]
MFQRIIGDVRDGAVSTLRLTILVAALTLALLITAGFLCAAAFVVTLDNFGTFWACLAGAGIFLIVALIAAGCYAMSKRRAEARERQSAKSVTQSLLADPKVVAAGLQIARDIGVKRLIPLLTVGGIALGLLASRYEGRDHAPAE